MVEIPCDGCAQPDHCRTRPNGCFGETSRSIGFGIVPGGTRLTSKTIVDPPKPDQPVLNNQDAGEHRPGGGFMPYFSKDGGKMKIKEYRERKHEIQATRDRDRNDPNRHRKPRGN